MCKFFREDYSGTQIIIKVFLGVFGVACIFRVVYLHFAPFSAENFIQPCALLLTFSLIYGFVALFKCLIVFIHKKCEAKKSTQIRNEILIGLGGILICGIVPRILVFFLEINAFFILSSIFLLCAISMSLYHLFVYEWEKSIEIDLDANLSFFLKFSALHVFVLYVTIRVVMACDFGENDKLGIINYQLILGVFSALVTFDLYDVLSGKRTLEGVDEKEEPAENALKDRLESVKVVKKAEEAPSSEHETCQNQGLQAAQTHPKIDCKVCRVEYSDARIPRNLKECGHTICEDCADILLDENQMQFLLCPFCKIVTAVNGPASMLHKSYAIMEIINDLKD